MTLGTGAIFVHSNVCLLPNTRYFLPISILSILGSILLPYMMYIHAPFSQAYLSVSQ